MALTFHDFWSIYPSRKGGNPKVAARTKWDAALKSGATPEVIINGARAFRDEMIASGQIGTEFVPMARTWLFQKRYLDHEPDPDNQQRNARIDADMAKRGYRWTGQKWEKSNEMGPTEIQAAGR